MGFEPIKSTEVQMDNYYDNYYGFNELNGIGGCGCRAEEYRRYRYMGCGCEDRSPAPCRPAPCCHRHRPEPCAERRCCCFCSPCLLFALCACCLCR